MQRLAVTVLMAAIYKVLESSVMTQLRCDGYYDIQLRSHIFLVVVKKILKSLHI